MPSIKKLTLVTAGLELEGGGRAVVGRLLAAQAAEFAEERGLGFEILSLRGAHRFHSRSFHGNTAALALTLWRRHAREGRGTAYIYDLLGLARVEAFMPRALRPRYLVVLHGIEIWRALSRDRARALRLAAIRLANSTHTLERGRRFVPGLQADVLHLALEERTPAGGADAAVLAAAGSGFLLMVGRMMSSERYKGHQEVLTALRLLAARRPDARLVVTGDGNDRRRLEARAAELGVAPQVLFTGFVSEQTLQQLYRRCAAMVLPSRGEGFGLVYLEAMRAQKPCVAARGSAAEEIVEPGVTGLLVDPDDSAEVAAALERLLADPAAAGRMGQAGHRRWAEVFDLTRFRARLWPHLDRLVEGSDVRD